MMMFLKPIVLNEEVYVATEDIYPIYEVPWIVEIKPSLLE
jgi:hypothetical protein